jgi:cysteinyl-tRNA synthetase
MVGEADRDFFVALRDDLNVPKARACLFELLNHLNERIASSGFSQCDAQLALDFLYRADRVLCMLDFGQPMFLDEQLNLLIEERNVARASGDYAQADALRRELEALGVSVEDTPSGPRVRVRE